jgi:hypothetical protein
VCNRVDLHRIIGDAVGIIVRFENFRSECIRRIGNVEPGPLIECIRRFGGSGVGTVELSLYLARKWGAFGCRAVWHMYVSLFSIDLVEDWMKKLTSAPLWFEAVWRHRLREISQRSFQV